MTYFPDCLSLSSLREGRERDLILFCVPPIVFVLFPQPKERTRVVQYEERNEGCRAQAPVSVLPTTFVLPPAQTIHRYECKHTNTDSTVILWWVAEPASPISKSWSIILPRYMKPADLYVPCMYPHIEDIKTRAAKICLTPTAGGRETTIPYGEAINNSWIELNVQYSQWEFTYGHTSTEATQNTTS